jgi:CxxC motif-containing protein
LIPALLEEIYAISVSLPVKRGDLLAEFKGVQVIATRSMTGE